MTRARAAAASALAFALVVGCDGERPAPSEVRVALGGTAPDGSGFVALGGDVTLIAGAQGGFHVWVKYRATGMRAETITVTPTARRRSDGRLVLRGAPRFDTIGAVGPDGTWEAPAPLPAFMCPSPIGVRIQDEAILFHLDLADAEGVPLGSAEAVATPRCPDGPQAAFCNSICTG
jgi:hypothetical protein